MTFYITRVVAGEPTKIKLTNDEVFEAKAFYADMLSHERKGIPFNKAFLLHKDVRKESGTYQVGVVLKRLELEECSMVI